MIDAVVVSRNDEALGICSFELAAADGSPLPAFSAGAHIDVHLPGGLVRQYSLCNHPEERHRYLIGVLDDPASRGGSRSLHQQVGAGASLRISEPRNLFPLTAGARRSLLFAGGIGITPILCMAEQLSHSGADFELHYCARSCERAAFLERIRHSPFADRLFVHFDEQPETALDIARYWAVRMTMFTCMSVALVVSCSTYWKAPGRWAGKKPTCTGSTSLLLRSIPAAMAVSRSRWAAPARSSRCRQTRAWCRCWSAMESKSPFPASRVFAVPA